MVVVALVAAILAGVGLVRARRRGEVRLAPDQELARLIGGALQRPEAFRHAPALFHRALLPLVSGRSISLLEAWDLAAAGRLFRSAGRTALALEAAGRGALVLDAAQAEGRAVADALGARDLDEWDGFLKRSGATPLTSALERRLGRVGRACRVRVAPRVGPPAILDLPGAGRIVVLDAAESWIAPLERSFATAPRRALFAAAERLAGSVGLDAFERAELLAPLAREAVLERDAGPGGAGR